jgi:hypothetical protein
MGVRRSAIYITIAALFAAGCSSHGSQNAIPQIAPQSKAAAPRQIVAAAATTTAQYSVGISDVTTGGFLYEICDKNVWYTAPSTSPCAGNYAPPISGQKSISRSASFSAANCPSGAQPAQSGSCSLSMTMIARSKSQRGKR